MKVNAFDKAENHLRRSLGIFTDLVGRDDVRTSGVVDLLGQMYWHLWQYPEAEKYLSEALPGKRRSLGADHPETLETIRWLGWAYYGNGRAEKAEELLSSALATSREAWGERHGSTSHIVAALAENYARQGLTYDAEKLMLESVGVGEQSDGSQSQISIQNLTYLCFFYLWQKNYDDAERWASKALKASLESKGEGHSLTFLCRIVLGMVYREQDRYDEAEKQFMSILKYYITDENVHVASMMHQLAALYQQQGRYAEAENLHLRVLNIRRNLLIENHPHTLGTIRGLIALYTAWGKSQEARKWFGELQTAQTNQSVANHYNMAKGTTNYDPVIQAYTLTAAPLAPWAIEKELDFSYPEPSSEMWHVCDELHFAHKTLNGDGSITARIESIDQANLQTQVGLMIRSRLEPTSENIAILVTPTGRVVFQCRTKPLEPTRRVFSDVNKITLPYWVRLTRKGNQFTARHSNDGINWFTVEDENSNYGSNVEIPMEDTVHIGMAITSNNSPRSTEAKMSNITVTGNVSSNGPFTASEDISLHSVTLVEN